jgi:hypothetical protein
VRRVAPVLVAALSVALLVTSSCAGGSTAPQPISWPTYGGSLTSANLAPPRGLTAANAKKLHVSWSAKLDGSVFASPVVVRTPAGRRIVVAGTEAGTVYALDAGNGRVVWSRSVTRTVGACNGTYGVSSTPWINERAGVVYVVGASGVLTALGLADGKVRWRIQVVRRISVEHVWSAVRVFRGMAYIGVASYCDEPDASGNLPDGYLLRVDVAHRKVVGRFDVVPGPNNLGGIWSWGGISVDTSIGAIFTSTGNSIVHASGNLIEDAGNAERVLQLTPALKVVDSTPRPKLAAENRGDEDFGATPLLFRPAGCSALVAANSKNGFTYVWRRGALSRPPLWSAAIGPTNPVDGFLGQPTYLPSLRLLVVPQTRVPGTDGTESRGISAYTVGPGCKRFTRRWILNIGGGPQAPPVAVGPVVVASAPAIHSIAVVDARTGVIQRLLDTTTPVFAPVATDGAALYVANTGGVLTRYVP